MQGDLDLLHNWALSVGLHSVYSHVYIIGRVCMMYAIVLYYKIIGLQYWLIPSKRVRIVKKFSIRFLGEVASVVSDAATLWAGACQAPLVHGISQARILEWVAISFSRGSSWPRDWTHISWVSCIGRRVLYCQHHLGRFTVLINPFQESQNRVKNFH